MIVISLQTSIISLFQPPASSQKCLLKFQQAFFISLKFYTAYHYP